MSSLVERAKAKSYQELPNGLTASMCGIAVAIDWDQPEHTVSRLVEHMRHRGNITDPISRPHPNVAMCTRRLPIVDPHSAIQPVESSDGSIVLAFNGEIYNHAALREELVRQGIRFKTLSDTEVLANALQAWGLDALGRLDGMFAFVAINTKTGAFLAARDPLGIKPLYVVQQGGSFLFCSEMKPLLQATETGDVLFVPPGHIVTKQGCVRYYIAFRKNSVVGSRVSETLDTLLANSVEARVPSDLKTAIFFSGGIDSTLVAHYARRVRPALPGYFLGNKDAPDYLYAEAYAAQTDFDLRLVALPQDRPLIRLLGDVAGIVEAFEPDLVRGAACTYLVAEQMQKDGVQVALTGEGADELFAGYAPLEYAFSKGYDVGLAVQGQMIDTMHRAPLQRVDRCSMHFTIETREVFLNPRITAFARDLPAEHIVGPWHGHKRGKLALRGLYDRYPDALPTAIRDRGKVPFDLGAGLPTGEGWSEQFDRLMSDADLRDGQKNFANFDLRSKEELFYLAALAQHMDVHRVPHLRERLRLRVPVGTPGSLPIRRQRQALH